MAGIRRLTVVDNGEDQEMDTGLKVAFATNDMKTVNQHFGSAEGFALYSVNLDSASFIEAIQFEKSAQDGNEGKLQPKMEALEGCAAVYAQAMGGSAIGQLKARRIQPVKVTAGASISSLIEDLQQELREGPSAWLARAMKEQQSMSPKRFDAMEAEGWEE